MIKKYQVRPGQIGFLYKKNKIEKTLEPGKYYVWDFFRNTELLCLPTVSRFLTITNQEVLTKDNIALRFSFFVKYKISDPKKFLSNFEINKNSAYIVAEAEQQIYAAVQVYIRDKILEISSEELNEKRKELADFKCPAMEKELEKLGVEIELAQLKDITFPKQIQDLFSKELEAKIRAHADLTNARTAVATARALKNASELMKGDENVKFFQYLETLTKIAGKGNHTFVMGDVKEYVK